MKYYSDIIRSEDQKEGVEENGISTIAVRLGMTYKPRGSTVAVILRR